MEFRTCIKLFVICTLMSQGLGGVFLNMESNS